MQRKIIHIDMDAFYASIEQRDFPEFKGKPLIVGGQSNRGVVSAASYEARKYGIYSAMPIRTALKRCPHVINQPVRMETYKKESKIIHEVFHEYSDLVEPIAFDEAFLDVTDVKKGPLSASLIAKEIKNVIYERTGLVASAGVSYNKFLAKIASDMDKPNGFFLILPKDAVSFLDGLKIEKFFGIGKVTAQRFHKLGIHTGGDLRAMSCGDLIRISGKNGLYLYNAVRGIDERPVINQRERKSVGCERTFMMDIYSKEEVNEKLMPLINEAWQRLEKSKKHGKTLTLKIKFTNFKSISRSHTFEHPIAFDQLYQTLIGLMPYDQIAEQGARLLGLSFSSFHHEKREANIQLKINFNQKQQGKTTTSGQANEASN